MDKELYAQALEEQAFCLKDKNRSFQYLWDMQNTLLRDSISIPFPKVAGNIPLGISVRIGWFPLIEKCMKDLNQLVEDNPGFNILVRQVKEKFGGLRIYAHFFSDDSIVNELGIPSVKEEQAELVIKATRIIHLAEEVADKTCDICGEVGEPRSLYGIHAVRCDKHDGK
jgi:hypothetical protein